MERTKYTIRYVSRITLEAETPLAIGSGEKDLLTDSLVATDVNGLPFIPGTSLAGVIRSACGIGKHDKTPFGYQDAKGGKGSRVIFSDGIMVGKDGIVLDGLSVIDANDPFYAHFKSLPIRQHVRINDKGTTGRGGKFDEQVAYKGVRFCFEMELLSAGTDDERTFYEHLLDALRSDTFRIGSGTRSGFGLMKTTSILRKDYDLSKADDLKSYVSRSASLDAPLEGAKEMVAETKDNKDWKHYTLTLHPSDFFLFGSGLGDTDADITPVREGYISWNDGKPAFHEGGILIPATSVKGALAHRTAYHWNRLTKHYVDAEGEKPRVGDDNPAVAAVFGKAGQEAGDEIKRGNIMLSDIILPASSHDDKLLNHVAIDRFTGGSMDGALFTEKVTNGRGHEIKLEVAVLRDAIKDEKVRQAFEESLRDIADGLLPLGGGVNRGHGAFTGTLTMED